MTDRSALVVVASTSAAEGSAADTTGPTLVSWLRGLGYETPDARVVADRDVEAAMRGILARAAEGERPDVVLTTGGTGLTADDRTVEAVAPHLDRELPGVVQAFFAAGLAATPHAALSRAVAGAVGRTFVMTLPGSVGAVRDAMTVLEPILDHIVDTLRTDHGPGSHADRRRIEDTGDGRAVGPRGRAEADPPGRDGLGGVCIAGIFQEPLEQQAERMERNLLRDDCGAVVRFEGRIRDHDNGRGVVELEYTAHPRADREIGRVAEEVALNHPGVRLAVAHRVGRLGVGDLAFLVLAASAHRAEAFAACSRCVDRVKSEVPIWKEQHFTDGAAQWVGIE